PGTSPPTSPLAEIPEIAAGVVPAGDDLVDAAGRLAATERLEQRLAGRPVTLCDHRDPAVVQVAHRADQAELERLRPRPPAETHTLHEALHPRRQPDGVARVAHSPATLLDGRPRDAHGRVPRR